MVLVRWPDTMRKRSPLMTTNSHFLSIDRSIKYFPVYWGRFSFSARPVHARSEHGQGDISQWVTGTHRRDKLACKRAGNTAAILLPSFPDEPLVPAERGRSSSISFRYLIVHISLISPFTKILSISKICSGKLFSRSEIVRLTLPLFTKHPEIRITARKILAWKIVRSQFSLNTQQKVYVWIESCLGFQQA